MRVPPSHVKRSSWRSRPRTPSHTSRPASNDSRVRAATRRKHTPPRLGQPPIRRDPARRALSAVDIVERHVEPAVLPVAIEVLPEVRQLQRGAERIRRAIEPRVVDARRCAARAGRPDSPSAGSSRARSPTWRSDASWYPDETRSADRRTATTGRSTGANGRTERQKHAIVRIGASAYPSRTRAADSASHPAAATAPRRAAAPRRQSRPPCARTRTARRRAAACAPAAASDATGKFS